MKPRLAVLGDVDPNEVIQVPLNSIEVEVSGAQLGFTKTLDFDIELVSVSGAPGAKMLNLKLKTGGAK